MDKDYHYPLKICVAIGLKGEKIAVVIDTSIGFVYTPISIKIEDVEELSINDVRNMDVIDDDTRERICSEMHSHLFLIP
ncbi:hypothetical protein [Prevotella melaninogenica]|uniref:hypothetical protein n=1 Tax=Prevotella melaninogenica TaxID=28132 RepID=UPI001BAA0F46|nr:hypothetical protein [Prevotella melaninogenica]QUB64865.1 hypothetical protein J5A57_04670 [Prevotella melaninogenica]